MACHYEALACLASVYGDTEGINMAKKIPDNLIVDTKGNISCKDGQDLAEYILKSALANKKALPSSVVLIDRDTFLALLKAAWANEHLIHAA